jgi:hypothetical protein
VDCTGSSRRCCLPSSIKRVLRTFVLSVDSFEAAAGLSFLL